MTTIGYFQQLGAQIDRAWMAADYSHAAFSKICAEAMEQSPPSRHVDADGVVAEAMACPRLPPQADLESLFGEPPLTLFHDDRFHITIDFWVDGTTSIHDHSFDGAFHVLEGSSIHTLFEFERTTTVNEHLFLGRLRERGIERLYKGDTRTIEGTRTVHSLFHLERPSATVVVRTWRQPSSAPLLSFERSGLAYATLYDHAQIKRHCDLLRLVQMTQPRRLPELYLSWMKSTDLLSRFIGLRFCVGLMSPEEADALLEQVARLDERLAGLIGPVVTEDRRAASIVRKRSAVTEPELRFFLAVLLNVRGRESALRLVQKEFPDRDPVEAVVQWCYALSEITPPPAKAASPLGFDMDEIVAATFSSLLRGEGEDGVARRVAAAAKRPLRRSDRAQLLELTMALKHSDLFSALLR
jgi:hypothetical protein